VVAVHPAYLRQANIHTCTYTGRTTTKHTPPVPLVGYVQGLNTTTTNTAHARTPRGSARWLRLRLVPFARCVPRPCGAVCVAPRGAALRAPLRLGALAGSGCWQHSQLHIPALFGRVFGNLQ
jgi:hypothetical protein